MHTAFEKLIDQVVNAVSHKIPDFSQMFVLVTDASLLATGAMLAQRSADGKGLVPVAFYHKTLQPEQTRYSTTERELLAVILALKRFRVYLGRPFELITDHKALTWLETMDMSDIRGRRANWLELLQQYQFTVTHKSGKSDELLMADYLSRVGPDGNLVNVMLLDNNVSEWVSGMSKSDVRQEQAIDPEIGPIVNSLRTGKPMDTMREAAVELWKRRLRLLLGDDGLLRYRNFRGRSTRNSPLGRREEHLVVLPQALRKPFLDLVHREPISGHMGRDRTWDKVRHVVWWPRMKKDVISYVAECDECGRHKRTKHPGRAPLCETEVPEKPFQKVQVDFCGPFPESRNHSFRYFLAMQDVLSRFVLLVPSKDCTADTAAKVVR